MINVTIDQRNYDMSSSHTIVINHKNTELLEKTLSNITSNCELNIVNNKNYSYDFSALRKEMEERYYLIFRNRCKNWQSSKLNEEIKPKIVVINLDYIKKKDIIDIQILFQSSCGSGIYIIIGYSNEIEKSLLTLIKSSPLELCF